MLAFIQLEASAASFLLAAAAAALLWANFAPDSYTQVWETRARFSASFLDIDLSTREWVGEGLMAFFFFLVGLEIKRELVVGELSDRRAALLPVLAAAGGMAVPALIYLSLTRGTDAVGGWGVPMATDLAFALGVLTLVRGVPLGARVFLLALAIADDIGSILVIGFFYSSGFKLPGLLVALLALGLGAVASRVGIRSLTPYVVLAAVVWLGFVAAGVSTSIAGVALALLTPARPMFSAADFDRLARQTLDSFPVSSTTLGRETADHEVLELAAIVRESVSPLARLELRLHPWVSFAIVPLFALANAGVELGALAGREEVAWAVAVSRMLGKPLGIVLVTWAAVRLGWGRLPGAVHWRHVLGIGCLAGIGFTVAFYLSGLAFGGGAADGAAKLGLLASAAASAIVGTAILRSRTVAH
jgi:NhaA family Na+:H+ antiporter